MQTIKVTDIIIGKNRQRKEFEPVALQELSSTIGQKGLMHAIVLRETAEGKVLVAGERRLRAITNLWMLGGTLHYNGETVPEGDIPYVTLGQLDPIAAEEAELEENLHRKDLTWQESATALARLHTLRLMQAQSEGRVHTVKDTAVEVKGRGDGAFQDSVRKDILVAKHLDNPEVAKAKSSDEAFKILKRQEETRKNVALAVEVGKTFTADTHKVINENCIFWMQRTIAEEGGVYDVILTDPPYGMGAQDFGDGGGGRLANSEHHYDDSYEAWQDLMRLWCPLSYAICKPQAHAYIFCDLDNFHELKRLMQEAGWYVFRTPFIHTKPNSGRVPLPEEGPRRQYEILLYAIKGHKHTTAIYPDVLTSIGDPGLGHGAQKPVASFEDLLKRSVVPGNRVLDTFAGTGTILPAAHKFHCEATAVEASPEYYGVCLRRLKELSAVPNVTAEKALGDELAGMLNALK